MALLVMFAVGLITVTTVVQTALVPTKTARPVVELSFTPQVIRDCVPNYADVSCNSLSLLHLSY